jgi:uncharacterized membrane protein YobD (UPF0266 family)
MMCIGLVTLHIAKNVWSGVTVAKNMSVEKTPLSLSAKIDMYVNGVWIIVIFVVKNVANTSQTIAQPSLKALMVMYVTIALKTISLAAKDAVNISAPRI